MIIYILLNNWKYKYCYIHQQLPQPLPLPPNKKNPLKFSFWQRQMTAILTNVFFGQFCPSIALQEEDGFVFEIKGWDQWRYDLSLFVVDKQLPHILIVYKLIKGKSALKDKWRQQMIHLLIN